MNTCPYDDGDMVYDYVAHKYVLTDSFVLSELGVNLSQTLNTAGDANPSTIVTRLLKRVSNSVYNYIYEHNYYPEWFERLMAKLPNLRDRIKQMLLAQLEYVLTNNFLDRYSGVNIAKGVQVDISSLRGAAKVAGEVEDLSMQIIPGLMYPLTYGGVTPRIPLNEYRRDY